jgi:hypothetical protein
MRIQNVMLWVPAICWMVVSCGCGGRVPTGRQPDMQNVASIRSGFGEMAATDDSPADAASPTGYATLGGTFKLNGDPPALSTLNSQINRDQEVCAPGGKPVYDQDLVVDSATKGIANIVIYAEKVPEDWVHEDARPGKSDEIDFDQKACVFLTRMVAIQTSQKLRVLNSDPVGHNLKVASFNQTIPSGGVAIYQPLREERAPVEMACSIHPWMKAWMITRDNSYFAVTQPDGSFEIPNLPAGVQIDLKVWQERIKAVTDVTVNGEATKWSKGRLTVTLDPDTDVNLDVVLDASLF